MTASTAAAQRANGDPAPARRPPIVAVDDEPAVLAAVARDLRRGFGERLASEHALIRSLEPGEEWSWCFVDQAAMLIPAIHGQTRIPPSPLGG